MLDVSAIPMFSYINLYKKELPSTAFMGFSISSSKNFLCFKEFYDYIFVGYCFLAYSEVFDVELNSNHQKVNEIALKEGWLLIELKLDFINKVSNWNQLTRKCFEEGIYLSCETKNDQLYIGRVISVDIEKFKLIAIGSDFSYKSNPIEINFLDIKSITIGSRYIEIYEAYSS